MALIRFFAGTLWYACFASLGKCFFWIAERGRTAESRLAEPLHADEVEQLSALLKLCASPNSVRNLAELDGFLVCLVISGEHGRSDCWLPLMFDEDWPAMEVARQRQLALLLLRRCYMIGAGLVRNVPEYTPIAARGLGALKNKAGVDGWCRGFVSATRLDPEAWHDLLFHSAASGWYYGIWKRATQPPHPLGLEMIRGAVRCLHAYWRGDDIGCAEPSPVQLTWREDW
jgi:yecA family protein